MVFREGKPVQDVQGASWLLSVRSFILSYVFPSYDIIHAMLHIVWIYTPNPKHEVWNCD